MDNPLLIMANHRHFMVNTSDDGNGNDSDYRHVKVNDGQCGRGERDG